MISIVICHRSPVLLERISKNIGLTIGVDYELVIIDNTSNHYTILSAYNEGVRRSRFPFICFTHEDVLFYTQNWGKNVIDHFQDPGTGMIGVTGGMAQSIVPGAWWYNHYFGKGATHLLMSSTRKPLEDLELYHNKPCNEESRCEVSIIDGLWFCIRKTLFEKISFDEKTYGGFHLYDADISMQVGTYAKRYVVYDILMQHVWNGSIDNNYFDELKKFADKWKEVLPVQSQGLKSNYTHILGWHSLRALVLDMLSKQVPTNDISDVVNLYKPLLNKNYKSGWFNLYFLLSRYFGYRFVNRLFVYIERMTGFSKTPGYIKTKYIADISSLEKV